MKKTAAVIAAVATIVLLFGGCQPTPTEEYTMKKDTERMLDQAGITEDMSTKLPIQADGCI